MIGYSYWYSRLIISVQMVFRLFVWIRDRVFFFSPPLLAIEISPKLLFCLLVISNMSRILPLSLEFCKRNWWNIRSWFETFSFSIHFCEFTFFFFHTDSLLFVRDYSLILLNVHVGTDQFIFFIFVHIRMKEEYNRNDLLSGKKKK